MAHPKRRQSSTRGRKRRTNWKLEAPNVIECSHCHSPRLPHHICTNCGFYDGRQIIAAKEA